MISISSANANYTPFIEGGLAAVIQRLEAAFRLAPATVREAAAGHSVAAFLAQAPS
jgi:hypothetical protein